MKPFGVQDFFFGPDDTEIELLSRRKSLSGWKQVKRRLEEVEERFVAIGSLSCALEWIGCSPPKIQEAGGARFGFGGSARKGPGEKSGEPGSYTKLVSDWGQSTSLGSLMVCGRVVCHGMLHVTTELFYSLISKSISSAMWS